MKRAVGAVCKTGLMILAGLFLLGSSGSAGRRSADGDSQTVLKEAALKEAASGETLSGHIRIAGSTSMEKPAEALAEGFMEKYPGVRVTVEYVGSSAGIEAVLSGSAEIGNSSRKLKSGEKALGAVENIVALDGIAVCTDPGNRTAGLTREQLQDIYAGEIRDWSQLGGEPFPIVVIGQEAGSGTREAFEGYLGLSGACVYDNELGSAGAVLARIAVTPGAVGYVSTQAVNENVNVLALEGSKPTAETIKDGSYPLSRPLAMVTAGEVGGQSLLIRTWFEYVLGDEGRAVIEKMGLVPAE